MDTTAIQLLSAIRRNPPRSYRPVEATWLADVTIGWARQSSLVVPARAQRLQVLGCPAPPFIGEAFAFALANSRSLS